MVLIMLHYRVWISGFEAWRVFPTCKMGSHILRLVVCRPVRIHPRLTFSIYYLVLKNKISFKKKSAPLK